MEKKNYSLELIRVISCIMVIMIHVSNYFCRGYGTVTGGEYLFSVVCNGLSRVSVPCFFMLSGALLLGRNEPAGKSIKKAGRFFLALAVWSVAYYLFNTYVTHQDTFTGENFLRKPAEAHLWYLYVMIPVYLVLPFLQSMCRGLDEKGDRALVIIGSVWVAALYILDYHGYGYYYSLPVFGGRSYVYYLLMGYMIKKYLPRIPGKARVWLGGYLAAVVLNVIQTVMMSNDWGKHNENFFAYGNPLVIISALCIFAGILKLDFTPGEKLKRAVDSFCGCSFGIYLVHIFFLDLYKVYLGRGAFSAYLACPVLTLLLTGISFLVVWLLRRTGPGRRIT